MIRNTDISSPSAPISQSTGVEIIGRPLLQPEHKVEIPLFACAVTAGFPSPAEDWVENIMDMNELLIKRPAATFLLRVRGDSMVGAGIFEGDILLVDRSISPHDEHIVIASNSNELTVKRLRREKNRLWLVAENPSYKPILVTEDVSVWGVVTSAIRRF
jgi:DNA polymerase V